VAAYPDHLIPTCKSAFSPSFVSLLPLFVSRVRRLMSDRNTAKIDLMLSTRMVAEQRGGTNQGQTAIHGHSVA